MKKIILIVQVLIVFSVLSCQKSDELPTDPIIGLGGDVWVPGEIDAFIEDNFIKTYNIEVKYKWDPYEVNYNRTLVPPDEERVIPVLEAVRDIWMKPYEKLGGGGFLKTYALSKFVLVGSAEYQSNGTIILGTAEGGTKITLFVVNDFEPTNRAEVIRMLHTIHHEFAHILHQTIDYPQAWRGLSSQWYTATWFNSTNAQANAQGLITAYAKAAEREDFVETIAFLLVEGQAAFDAVVAANPDVANIFRTKEELVVSYYRDVLNIDFRELQAEVSAAIQSITAPQS
ncbi:substrate import-associated zinc metallohydrolase lipoprotein [Parapedobacter composti]|uniref:Substrate import-associated zinc metallohydrolase lipoprotein n=1 Tax=Parapedobacter composti TaxID=623281 RepID=A0A1I1EZP8_9SPHI|nr:putative zinc-binding metallopeptidase [Parapedobacter composti]SFB92216.1 substrate import-associated zinc metallohydrolase lipoprotein [Parapedobacter composti]